MEKVLSPKFIQKMFQGGKYAFVAAIFTVSLNYFGYLTISSGYLTGIYIYLIFNGSAAGAIIYRGHQVFVTEKYCPNCGSLKFEK